MSTCSAHGQKDGLGPERLDTKITQIHNQPVRTVESSNLCFDSRELWLAQSERYVSLQLGH